MKEIILQKSNFRCCENIYIYMSTAKAPAAPSGRICEKIVNIVLFEFMV